MTITKSGTLASFYTVNKAPIKHLRVYFSPKQAGSGTASPENVREISGWNQIELYNKKKSLFPFLREELTITSSNYNGNSGWFNNLSVEYIPKTTLVYSVYLDATNSEQSCYSQTWIMKKDGKYRYSTGNTISAGSAGWSVATMTVTNNDDWLAFGLSCKKGVTASKPMVEIGSIRTEYEPYGGSTQTIDWSNDIGTIYGGYVDLITGELVKTHNLIHYDGTENWEIKTSTNNPINSPYTARIYVSDGFRDGVHYSTVYSNKLKPEKNYYTQLYGVSLSYTSVFNVGTPSQVSDISSFRTWMNDIQGVDIIYPLQNPITNQLTPTQLQTFLGRNNIWSNADRIEVEYDLAESNDELYRRRNILLQSAPHLETAADNIANFKTDLIAPIKECKINFLPAQEGTGDPSLTNVREISGWSGIDLHHTQKNLINLETATFKNNSSNITTTINGNTITVTAKKHLDNFLSQATLVWTIPPALIGKSIYMGCTEITHNNNNHNCSVVCEYQDKDNKRIADPTVILLSSNTIARKYTIPNGAVKAEIYFRIAQNVGTYNVEQDDYVTYSNFYIRYPDETYGYEVYNGETIPITFPAVGKNLFDKNAIPYQTGKYIYDVVGGIPQYSNNSHYNVYRIPIKPATTYTFGPIKGGSSGSGPIWATTHGDGIASRYVFNAGGSAGITHTFTSYSSDRYLLLSIAIDDEYGYKCNDILQVEQGSTATAYEPYEYIYGGYIDLITGQLVQEWNSLTIDGVTTNKKINSDYSNDTHIIGGLVYLTPTGVSDGSYVSTSVLCNNMPVIAENGTLTNLPTVKTINAGSQYLRFYMGFKSEHTDLDTKQKRIDFCNTWFQENPTQVVYKLRTPIIYQLTSTQLNTLKGTNNIWSSANGPVSIKYWTH